MVNEFQTPALIQEYFKFTCTFMGRGLVFLFLGCVVIRQEKFNIIAGIIAAAVGVFYFILSFTPGIPKLLGLFIVFRERRAYLNEREAKKLSQEAIKNQTITRNGTHHRSNPMLANKPPSPFISTHPSQTSVVEQHTHTSSHVVAGSVGQPVMEARRSRVSIQLSQISLPEGAAAQFEPPAPAPALASQPSYPYPYATTNASRPSINDSQGTVSHGASTTHVDRI
ncbi:hypothetical protein BDF22DRAFT_696487, partial [Syncephalis plumigaleata]